jgi:hypothetical protein
MLVYDVNLKYWVLISILLALLALALSPNVKAQEDDTINLLELPEHLAQALGVPEYAGKLLASACIMLIFLLPMAIFGRNNMILIMLSGFILMGFLIAIGWLEYWFLLIIVLIISAMYSGKIKEWIT